LIVYFLPTVTVGADFVTAVPIAGAATKVTLYLLDDALAEASLDFHAAA